MIRVLVVDDSASMRALITAALSADPAIAVVGEAADPLQARTAIKALNPDVVTLDVEMPNMSGLEFLEKLMRLRPTRVVMVSTLTHAGADAAVQALELGAVECVGKPTTGSGFADLASVVRAAATVRLQPRAEPTCATGSDYRPSGSLVAIGASTGGVEALCQLLARFPENCPPTLITQHMPEAFTRSFAARLHRLCAAHVEEAQDGAPIRPGKIYLAPGGVAHLEVAGSGRLWCRLSHRGPVSGHRPSVDVMFGSVARALGASAVGVILTGMGRDGAAGLLAMRQAGARTLGQDENSCVVYGMPKIAGEIGAVGRELPLHRIADAVLELTRAKERAA